MKDNQKLLESATRLLNETTDEKLINAEIIIKQESHSLFPVRKRCLDELNEKIKTAIKKEDVWAGKSGEFKNHEELVRMFNERESAYKDVLRPARNFLELGTKLAGFWDARTILVELMKFKRG